MSGIYLQCCDGTVFLESTVLLRESSYWRDLYDAIPDGVNLEDYDLDITCDVALRIGAFLETTSRAPLPLCYDPGWVEGLRLTPSEATTSLNRATTAALLQMLAFADRYDVGRLYEFCAKLVVRRMESGENLAEVLGLVSDFDGNELAGIAKQKAAMDSDAFRALVSLQQFEHWLVAMNS